MLHRGGKLDRSSGRSVGPGGTLSRVQRPRVPARPKRSRQQQSFVGANKGRPLLSAPFGRFLRFLAPPLGSFPVGLCAQRAWRETFAMGPDRPGRLTLGGMLRSAFRPFRLLAMGPVRRKSRHRRGNTFSNFAIAMGGSQSTAFCSLPSPVMNPRASALGKPGRASLPDKVHNRSGRHRILTGLSLLLL